MNSGPGPTKPLIVPLPSSDWANVLPETVFTALAGDPTLFWLDAGDSNERWSYLGTAPLQRISSDAFLKQPAVCNPDIYTAEWPPFHNGVLVQLNYPGTKPPYSFQRIA